MRLHFIHKNTSRHAFILYHMSAYTSCTHVQSYKCSEATENKDEEDFDQFLESVKARQLSLTAKGELTLTHHVIIMRSLGADN